MELQATDRIDSRLTVVDWPHAPDSELHQAVLDLVTLDSAESLPAVVADGDSQHLVWLGYLTGGLLTLYAGLGAMLQEHGLSAFFADRRLEAFVPAEGPVRVMGALRHPIELAREEWEIRLDAATDAQDLTEAFLKDAFAGAGEVFKASRDAEADMPVLGGPRAASIPQRAPGEVLLELIEDAELRLVENYEPEGMLQSAEVECYQPNWRTDVLAPSFPVLPEDEQPESFTWRATQWRWDSEEPDGEGDWTRTGFTTLQASDVYHRLPESLHAWVCARTEEAAETAAQLADEVDPAFGTQHRQLVAELAELPAQPEPS